MVEDDGRRVHHDPSEAPTQSDPYGSDGSDGSEGSSGTSNSTLGRPPVRTLPPGTAIDRFIVLELIGMGGMGQVYRARDPSLDRDVALKLLREVNDIEARQRLLREAQAMARLSHPNVLPIYGIGTMPAPRSGLYIAMELVAGQTVRHWLRNDEPSLPEILRVFLAAGRGLAAAHDAGLVHRDFKPSNVMLDRRGRARVMDFGLVRAAADRESDDGLPSEEPSGFDQMLTRQGTVVGTPAYMAPEQHERGDVDTRSDQYAFCVSLWEAIYGTYPFVHWDVDQLFAAKLCDDPVVPAGRDRLVPRWLHDALLTGLAPEPDERFESMDALLQVLDRGTRRSRWPWVLGGSVAVLLGVVVVAGGLGASTRATPCQGARDRLAGTWDPDTRARLAAAVREVDVSYADDTWQRLEPRLDDYATRWVAAFTDACLDRVHPRDEPAAERIDARVRCLDGRLRHLRFLVETLTGADASVIQRAVQAALELPAIDRCADPAYARIQEPVADDPAIRSSVEAYREQLARSRAQEHAGRYDRALTLAQRVHREATALGFAPLMIEASLQVGSLQNRMGEYPSAAQTLREAYFGAKEHGMHEAEGIAASALVHVVGNQLAQPDEAMTWARHARAAAERLDSDELRAELSNSLGIVHDTQGKYDEALATFEEAISILESQPEGPSDPALARALDNLGSTYLELGRYGDALAVRKRALSILEQSFGPEHPRLVAVLNNIGHIHSRRGDYARGQQAYERALQTAERVLGPEHPSVAQYLNNVGGAYYRQEQHERAMEAFERALPILERAYGAQHPNVARTLFNVANILRDQGKDDLALSTYRRSLQMLQRALGPEHLHVSRVLVALGQLHSDRAEPDQARPAFERAVKIREQTLGPSHPRLVTPLVGLSAVLQARDDLAAATATIERAAELCEGRSDVDPIDCANARFRQARIMVQVGGDRGRAIELAELARGGFWAEQRAEQTADRQAHRATLAEIDAWLDAQRPGG